MPLFGTREVVGIARDALDFAREAAADTHPNEYMGLLRGERATQFDVDGGRGDYVVTDVLVIPATESSPTSATVRSDLVPNDEKTMGSIHSHPNGVLRPSDEDLQTFGRGAAHVILGAPYGPDDWRAFDREGDPRDLPVLDVDLDDPEAFFDFTQDDIDEELR
ncbi:MAG: Mov34/MPN/PAD-1 family protein [Halobacteriaceae archaeon]